MFGVSFFDPNESRQGSHTAREPHGVERAGMAEIKSTLELALERTQKMSISKEEKEEMKRREIAQKATGMFHRYMDDHLSLDGMTREIERMEERARATVRNVLLSQWIDAVSLDAENEKLLRGIEFLKGRNVDDVKQKLEVLRSEYERETHEAEQNIGVRLAEALRKENIHGSAVVPHVRGSKQWKERMGPVEQAFGKKIEALKEVLRKL